MSMARMKQTCKHCPYRRDVKPFLHPSRGEELAYITQNPYNSFYCHKTTVNDEEFGGDGEEMVATTDSKMCAGFVTLQINEGTIACPKDFVPDPNVYEDIWEMCDAYNEDNEN